jgi:hypothetical protein
MLVVERDAAWTRPAYETAVPFTDVAHEPLATEIDDPPVSVDEGAIAGLLKHAYWVLPVLLVFYRIVSERNYAVD